MQILTIAHWSDILVLVNRLEKLKKKTTKALSENSRWWLWQRLLCPAKKKWKSNNGNEAIKSSDHDIFKTVNNIDPNYIKDIFTPKLHPNTTTCGTNSLKTLGLKIWS